MSEYRRHHSWSNAREKAEALDAGASLDIRFPRVQNLAQRFTEAHPHKLDRAHAIFKFVRDSIRYKMDSGGTGVEELADSDAILTNGADDCDGKARLFVAICRAARILARIQPVANVARGFYHVQASCLPVPPGPWLLAELIIDGVPLGRGPESGTRDASGKLHYAGPGHKPIDHPDKR